MNILHVEEIWLSFDYFPYKHFMLKYKPGEAYCERSEEGKASTGHC